MEVNWLNKPNTVALYFHLLLWSENGNKIVCSRKELSERTGLSEREVRTAIEHLKATKFVTNEATNNGTLITIEKRMLASYNDAEIDQVSDQQIDQQKEKDKKSEKEKKQREKEKNQKKKRKEKEKESKKQKEKIYISENARTLIHALPKLLQADIYEFMKMRQSIGKPIKTERALKILINRLQKYSDGDILVMRDMLNESILNNWQSVYPPKKRKRGNEVLDMIMSGEFDE